MPLNSQHFDIIELPPVSQEVQASFNDLPLDPYCGTGRGRLSDGKHRFRRFDDYRLHFEDGHWQAILLPHRPFIQSIEYNRAVGGVLRYLDPLKGDFSPQIDVAMQAIPLDTTIDWQIHVHQIRVITTPAIRGIAVVEGPHRDGHEYGSIAVFKRHNMLGGETELSPLGGGAPFFRATLQEGQAIVYADGLMWHNATDIEALDGGEGHRDIWILAINRWENRRWGPEFEKRALAGADPA